MEQKTQTQQKGWKKDRKKPRSQNTEETILRHQMNFFAKKAGIIGQSTDTCAQKI
jgi:hypothetical protein